MTTATIDAVRRAFETWAADPARRFDLTRNAWDLDRYVERRTQDAWEVWCACEESKS